MPDELSEARLCNNTCMYVIMPTSTNQIAICNGTKPRVFKEIVRTNTEF